MSKHKVLFTNKLGITMMVYDTEPTVAPAEDALPIDHSCWVYAAGAFLTAALQLALPFLLSIR